MAKRKNRAAQALGRRGGGKNTPKQQAARLQNISRAGGRPREYRIVDEQHRLKLQHRPDVKAEWRTLDNLSHAALIYLATWLREHKRRANVYWFDSGWIYYQQGDA